MAYRSTLTLLLALLTTPISVVLAQGLQSPADFLGYELGSRFSRHHQVVDYFEHVAANSDLVELKPYGETYEGRPLMVAFVGTPERINNLEQVRQGNLQHAGLAEAGTAPGEVPIVWLSYNVHGNESVSTEASMATLYELVRPGGKRDWLDGAMVVIDPCINPDGRDRYANWYNQAVGFRPNANPDAREHREPWPGGRTNHYHFDLNRDWAWLSQQESQHRLALYNAWLPQVHVDFHEQGVNSPYYFAPAAEPYHTAVTDWQRAFQDSVGTNHARYFDKEGWLYFTREVFDLFYPGYGDTYPIFNGGIGMTYEQGGGGRAGLAIQTAEGDTLTLGDRILHHHTTGLSTIETTVNNAEAVLTEFAKFYQDAKERPGGANKSFIMKASSGSQRLAALASHLDLLGIEYGSVDQAGGRISGLDYRSGATIQTRPEPGDLLVNLHQPKGVLTRVLFEPDPFVPDSLTYDITAWALPYAYGLDAIATSSDVRPDAAFSVTPPSVPASNGAYAYALRWDSPEDVVFLAAALQEGIDGRVNTEPFTADDQEFAAGTVLFTRAANESMGDQFHSRLLGLAQDHEIELIALHSGRVSAGSDMGSGRVRYVSAPNVLVATGSPVSSYSAGQVWHWFEQQVGYPVTMVNAESLAGTDLSAYDVVVLPSGSYGGILTEGFTDDLRSWVRSGGRLIAIDGAARSLAAKDGFSLERKAADEDDEEGDQEADRLQRYEDRVRDGLTTNISGAIFRTRVDESHPLGFGMARGYYSLRRSSSGYDYLEDGWNVGVIEAGSRLSGKVGSEADAGVEESLAFGVQDMGRGSVTFLMDDPLFRAFWYEGRLLMGNAVFLGGR